TRNTKSRQRRGGTQAGVNFQAWVWPFPDSESEAGPGDGGAEARETALAEMVDRELGRTGQSETMWPGLPQYRHTPRAMRSAFCSGVNGARGAERRKAVLEVSMGPACVPEAVDGAGAGAGVAGAAAGRGAEREPEERAPSS